MLDVASALVRLPVHAQGLRLFGQEATPPENTRTVVRGA